MNMGVGASGDVLDYARTERLPSGFLDFLVGREGGIELLYNVLVPIVESRQ